jgi:Aspartyl protease
MQKIKVIGLTFLLMFLNFKTFSQDSLKSKHPLQISENGIILVKAEINGVEGTFVFDTGAGIHTISSKFFKKINPNNTGYKNLPVYTAYTHNGVKLELNYKSFTDLKVGAIIETNPIIAVHEGFDNTPFDGIIGAKLYEKSPIIVDYKNKCIYPVSKPELKLISKKSASIPIELEYDKNKSLSIFISLQVGNKNAKVEFDTGTTFDNIILKTKFMADLNVDSTKLKTETFATIFGGQETIYYASVSSLKLTNYPVVKNNIVVTFKPTLIYEGLIGAGFFKEKKMLLDIRQKRMFILD